MNETEIIEFSEQCGPMLIPGFRVSTAILNITDFSRRWCKLNFGSLRGHVK